MPMNPLISIIITVYNGKQFLNESIDSVLHQTYTPLELIVIDDGSTDGSAALIQQYGSQVRYRFQENQGISPARNAGVALAKGSYLAFHDADDLFTPERLALQMAAFDADPGLEAVFGHVQQFYTPELGNAFKRRFGFHTEVMPARLPTGMLIKKAAFTRVGPFIPYQVGQSIDWYMRAQEKQLVTTMLKDVVFRRRLHKNNLGVTHREEQTVRLQVLKDALDRRRLAQMNDTAN